MSHYCWDSLVPQTVKASACNAGDPGSIPGSGKSPGEGNGNPLQYSCLENSTDGGAWWATAHEVTKSQTRLSDFASLISCSLISSGVICVVPGVSPSSLPETEQSSVAMSQCDYPSICPRTPGLLTTCFAYGRSRLELPGHRITCCPAPESSMPKPSLAQPWQRLRGDLLN